MSSIRQNGQGLSRDSKRLSVSKMISRGRQHDASGDGKDPKMLSAQEQVREMLKQRSQGGRVQLEDLRRTALGDHLAPSEPSRSSKPKSLKLSLAQARLAEAHKVELPARRPTVRSAAQRPAHRQGSTSTSLSTASSSSQNRGQKKKHAPLKDSVYFFSDREYEAYLLEELERQGLFRELFEQLKILYISRKDIHALTGLFEHLPDLDLSDCELQLEKAEAFRALGDMDKAFLFLDKAVRLNPESVTALRSLSYFHKHREEYELSLHWLEKWGKLRPDEADVHYQKGVIYHRLKQDLLSRGCLLKCLEVDPKHLMAQSLFNQLKV